MQTPWLLKSTQTQTHRDPIANPSLTHPKGIPHPNPIRNPPDQYQ